MSKRIKFRAHVLTLIPPGQHTFEIVAAKPYVTRERRSAMEVTVRPQDPQYSHRTLRVWYPVDGGKGHWRARRLFHAVGLPDCEVRRKRDLRYLELDDLIGRRFSAEVRHEPYQGRSMERLFNVLPVEGS